MMQLPPAAKPAPPTGRLSHETADAMQRVLFAGAPGAAELLLEVWNGTDERRRERSRRALRALDPYRPALSPVEDLAHDVALLLVAMVYGGELRERVRIAYLLQQLCDEAAQLAGAAA
jgi:hypothetical protein